MTFQQGVHGDIIDFVIEYEGVEFLRACEIISGDQIRFYEKPQIIEKPKPFILSSYFESNEDSVSLINDYACKRQLSVGWIPARFFTKENDISMKRLAIGFVHRDENFDITGVKLRCIDPDFTQRFVARGKLNYFILAHRIYGVEPTLYIIEGESNAISLYLTLQKAKLYTYLFWRRWNYPQKTS